MEVRFELILSDEAISENAIPECFPVVSNWLKSHRDPEGVLILYNTVSFEVISLRDPLDLLIRGLCLDAVLQWVSGHDVDFSLVSTDYTATFSVEGIDIDDKCDLAAFVQALTGCAERYISLLERVHGEDSDWSVSLASWREKLVEIRSAVQAWLNQE